MKEDTKYWLKFSSENLDAARILLNSQLYNTFLQNLQQSIEKSLKALFLEYSIKLVKSHSILELRNTLKQNRVSIDLEDDECDLIDSIYLPSKYPIGSALPDFYPDDKICRTCLEIAENVTNQVVATLKGRG